MFGPPLGGRFGEPACCAFSPPSLHMPVPETKTRIGSSSDVSVAIGSPHADDVSLAVFVKAANHVSGEGRAALPTEEVTATFGMREVKSPPTAANDNRMVSGMVRTAASGVARLRVSNAEDIVPST